MFLEADDLNHQHLSCWNIATVANRKGSSEVIMEIRDGNYVSTHALRCEKK